MNLGYALLKLFLSDLRDDFRIRIEVDGVVVPPHHEVPSRLYVRNLHCITNGLDMGAGGSCNAFQIELFR